VTLVLGAVPRIVRHRETLAQLVTFDVAQVDSLQEYALALGHAHGMRRAAPGPPVNVAELARSQKAIREQLLTDARALASRALLDPERIARLDSGPARLSIAFDVIGLVELFLQSWSAIRAKTAVPRAELEHARSEANRLIAELGRRRRRRGRGASAADDDPHELTYRQIYTRLVRAYVDVRQALLFVRRAEGDANRIAPSPYRGRPKRSRKRAGSSR